MILHTTPNTDQQKDDGKNFFATFMYRFVPYWPLFLILMILGGAGAFAYLKYFAKPVYQVDASVLVEDGKKGADESKLMEALNISSNKIVDNEIEVLKSKELLKEIIDSLKLCTPVSEEGMFISTSAYTTSPVTVEAEDPSNAPADVEKVYFTYDAKGKKVVVENKAYPINEWVKTKYGTLRFEPNAHYKHAATGKLYFSFNDPRAVLDGLSTGILIAPASKLSSVIYLTKNDEVPERGEDILNLLISNYYQSAVRDKNSLATNMMSFVEERIGSVSSELDSIERQMQQFRNQSGTINLSEQGKMYLQNVGDNDRKMTDLNMQLAMLNEVEKYVVNKQNGIGIVPSLGGLPNQQLLSGLLQKLYDSQLEYERMKKTVPQGNPTMYSLQSEIENMRPRIIENIQNQRQSLLAGKNSLEGETGRYYGMLNSIPQKEKQLLDISRQQAIKNDAYSFLLQKREEAALAYAAMVSTSKTINKANASFLPVSPKKTFVMASSIVAALLLGFGFVMLKETLTNKILFRSDIENITEIPIVAEIASVKTKKPLLLSDTPEQKLSSIEQFYQLRFGLGLNGRLLKHKKILITSGTAGEGKSFISNNLARSLALSGKKVALIDFDFRKPKTSETYQLKVYNGVAEYLEKEEVPIMDIIYPTDLDGLFILPAGYCDENPTELLFKKDISELIHYLEDNFDYVIMDTPPIDPVIDAFLVAEHSDAILFVVRHGHSSKAMLESLQKNQKISALKNNLFIVFNGIKPRGFIKKGYGFGYGYGSNKMYGDKTYQYGKVSKGVNA